MSDSGDGRFGFRARGEVRGERNKELEIRPGPVLLNNAISKAGKHNRSL